MKYPFSTVAIGIVFATLIFTLIFPVTTERVWFPIIGILIYMRISQEETKDV